MPLQAHAKRRTATQPSEKPAKRTRVSRACDQCRIAREKCDGLQPTCTTCSGSKRVCAYTTNPKKRGIQPGYIRSLELALAWLFQQNSENETLLNDKLSQVSSLFLSRDSKESNKLHKRWRKTRFYTDVDKLLSGGEPSRHEQFDQLSPDSSDEDFDTEELFPVDANDGQTSNKALQPDSMPQDLSRPHVVNFPQHEKVATTVSIPANSWTLLESYFTYTQCWLPICEKHDVLKLSYSYPAEGLSLSPNQADSGAHAELWSVLAVASLYDQTSTSPSGLSSLYDMARSLIPGELGIFEIGHVKALLNLAIFNISQTLTEAAWILVGCASRVLEYMGDQTSMAASRGKHVFLGCFLLDSMIALQLGRRPYFQKSHLEWLGMVDEDGLEEWEPWSGGSTTSIMKPNRTPILALSTFNNLLGLLDILVSAEQSSGIHLYKQDIFERLEIWKSLLPLKLSYLRSGRQPTPSNPPASLLQFAYFCVSLASNPSDLELHQLLEFLERCQDQIGFKNLSPLTQCLIGVVGKYTTYIVMEESTRSRLQTLESGILGAWRTSIPGKRPQVHSESAMRWRSPLPIMQMPTPESLQAIYPIIQSVDRSVRGHSRDQPIPIGASAPDSHAMTDPLLLRPSPSQSDARYPEVLSDLESFFDELATLDNATRLDNQPQFMQNLGFAPDANMADLFSEYIPLQSATFLIPGETAPVNFNQYNFYDAS